MNNRNRLAVESLEQRHLLTAAPELVFDINPGIESSDIQEMFVFRDELYFRADDGTNGVELWKSDGTSEGTVLLKNINSGEDSSSPGWFAEFQGELFFTAADASTGDELWKTDGTTTGTVRVHDIFPGDKGSSPSSLFEFENELYFAASAGTNNDELWKSDGTTSGTLQIKDIKEGSGSSNPGGFSGFYTFNNQVYFNADNRVNGVELWRTDGTEEGTTMVIDVDRGDGSAWPFDFFEFSDDLYFTADRFSTELGTFFSFLYRVDGETGEAELAVEVPIDWREGVLVAGDQFFFSGLHEDAGFEPFRSDGTAEGTFLLRDIMTGPHDSNPKNFLAVDDKVYFAAGDEVEAETERVIPNLWVTDGTIFGTKQVSFQEVNPDNEFVEFQGNVYFSAFDEELGWELFQSDGTVDGTRVVHDVNLGANDSLAKPQIVFEGELLFTATEQTSGLEIWTTDGTTTKMLADTYLGGGDFTQEPALFEFFEFGDSLVFYGGTPFEGEELFIIRGSDSPVRFPGDVDGDGAVQFSDFLVLSTNFGKENAVWEDGDFDQDGTVGFSDFLVLSNNFGMSAAAAAIAADIDSSTQHKSIGSLDDRDDVALAVDDLFATSLENDLSIS